MSQDEIGLYVRGDGAVPEDAVAAEVQSVAFTGFDGSDAFKLSFGGAQTTTFTRGVNYTADAIKAAVLAAVPVRGGLEGAAVLADRARSTTAASR